MNTAVAIKPKSLDPLAKRNRDNAVKLPRIPRRRYTDEDFYRLEIDHVFGKTWHMVAHLSEFSEPGSYKQVEMSFGPIVIVKGKDQKLRAFVNSCAHRGASVVRQDAGCTKVLSCPYHGWTYDLTGKLIGVPEEHKFRGLNLEEHGLKPVRLEHWGNFVFINFSDKAPSLGDSYNPFLERYSPLMDAPMGVIGKLSYEFPCNWKIVTEAFREGYHADFIHANSISLKLNNPATFFEFFPNGCNVIYTPFKDEILGQPLHDSEPLPDMPLMSRQEFQEYLVVFNMFPNYTLGTFQTGVGHVNAVPVAIDRTRLDVTLYGMDTEEDRHRDWNTILASWDKVMQEDIGNLESIQKSLKASASGEVILSAEMERALYELHVKIDEIIGADNVPEQLRVPVIARTFDT